jgi:hypothetical protein
MTSPGGADIERRRIVYLQALQLGFRERVGEFALSRLRYELWREYDPAAWSHRVVTEVLSRCSGPREYSDSRTASVDLVRFASWWDHFKATYRRRWWMRWRGWRVNYTLRTATATAQIRIRATATEFFPHAQDLPEWLGPAYPVIAAEEMCLSPEDGRRSTERNVQ